MGIDYNSRKRYGKRDDHSEPSDDRNWNHGGQLVCMEGTELYGKKVIGHSVLG